MADQNQDVSPSMNFDVIKVTVESTPRKLKMRWTRAANSTFTIDLRPRKVRLWLSR